MLAEMVWSGWAELGRMVAVGTLTCLSALNLLRLADQQASAKMTAYALLATLALGSVLAAALLSPQVKLHGGAAPAKVVRHAGWAAAIGGTAT